jgi:predicted acetyltransferase
LSVTTAAPAVRRLEPDEVVALAPVIARLHADAYPIMRVTTDAAFEVLVERARESATDPERAQWVVAERDGEVVGLEHLYDFTMNVRGRDAFTGGVGGVAVSLAHKRRGVARALIAWYLEHYRARGAPFAALYPFRLDFYRKLGFGYGAPVYRYRFAPATLRADGADGRVRVLGEADADAVQHCYERLRTTTHGLMTRITRSVVRTLADREITMVGVERDGVLRGFMQTTVRLPGDETLRNRDELVVRDLFAEDHAALAALIGYLRAQSDQFARVRIESGDPALFLASDDPRDGSDLAVSPPAVHRVAEAGLGIMYRIVDLDAALAYVLPEHDTFALRLDVRDDVLPRNSGAHTFRFAAAGTVRDDAAAPDATLAIGIGDLSSAVMGSLRVRDLVRYGRASVEPASRIAQIDAAFRTDTPPQCATRF